MPEKANDSIPDTAHKAEGPQELSDNIPYVRALATKFAKTQLIQQEDGALLIKGVKLLASGTWTDSAIQTPLFYPKKTLQEYASNWQDLSVWDRHTGGQPRSITSKVGEVENPHYEDDAVMGDIRLHGATQTSRDVIELVKRKLISFVSVEHGGNEAYNPTTRQNESSSITFTGLALVNKGACKLCRLNEESPVTVMEPIQPILASVPSEASDKELSQQDENMTKELEEKVAALQKELEELKATPAPAPAPVIQAAPAAPDYGAIIHELQAKITQLENRPQTAPVQSPAPVGKVEFVAIVDKRNGTVRSV